ncbi:hypothetical protein ACFQ1I_31070 [Kitasatospora arboriphila]
MSSIPVTGRPVGLLLAESGGAADLAAFLRRLLRFDRAAAVRLQAVPGPESGGVLAVFGGSRSAPPGRSPSAPRAWPVRRTGRTPPSPPGSCWRPWTRRPAASWCRRRSPARRGPVCCRPAPAGG